MRRRVSHERKQLYLIDQNFIQFLTELLFIDEFKKYKFEDLSRKNDTLNYVLMYLLLLWPEKNGNEKSCILFSVICILYTVLHISNGNDIETKANKSFDNGVFFDMEAKRTPLIVSKLFSKRSGHIRQIKNYFRSEANPFGSEKTILKVKRHVRQ